MSQAFYRYYEQELLFIRQMSQQFARQYPAAAGRLLLEPNRSADPHVERLIEAFAFLTARIQNKLDDDFPEVTDALLNVLYPHYLAPIPSMSVVQFELEPANAKPEGLVIPRGSQLHSQRVGDTACQFRSCYPVTLWPLEIRSARLQPLPLPSEMQPPQDCAAALRLELTCQGEMQFSAMELETLRLHLTGAPELVADLYELIFNNALRVEFRPLGSNSDQQPLVLKPQQCLQQVGFDREEGLLPYRNQSFLGYRLLTELFAFPEKFHFLDLGGFDRVRQGNFGKRMEVVIYLRQTSPNLEREVDKHAFQLGCTPIVNLFRKTAEPLPLTQKKHEYRVVPDVHRQNEMEVYSVDSVLGADPRNTRHYKPFYSIRHDSPWAPEEDEGAWWYASRKDSLRDGDAGTEVLLHLVDMNFNPKLPADSTLVVETTCTNRDLPLRMQQAGMPFRFELESAAPLRTIRCLRTPTTPRRPPRHRQAYWRLLSHLSLNHQSISDPLEGTATLKEMLRLYDFSDPHQTGERTAVNRGLIEGIRSVNSRRVVGRVGSGHSSNMCRGVEVTLELDEQSYVGTGSFLFASVLEHFLGLYSSINSFTQLVVKMRGSDGVLKRWPPRAGERPLL